MRTSDGTLISSFAILGVERGRGAIWMEIEMSGVAIPSLGCNGVVCGEVEGVIVIQSYNRRDKVAEIVAVEKEGVRRSLERAMARKRKCGGSSCAQVGSSSMSRKKAR